jgi:hypothetical protein
MRSQSTAHKLNTEPRCPQEQLKTKKDNMWVGDKDKWAKESEWQGSIRIVMTTSQGDIIEIRDNIY